MSETVDGGTPSERRNAFEIHHRVSTEAADFFEYEIRTAVAAENEACAASLEARAARLESRARPGVNDWPDDTLMAKAASLRGGAALIRARKP